MPSRPAYEPDMRQGDAHSMRELNHMHWGVEMAREGGVPAARDLNAMALSEITRYLKRRRTNYARAA